MTRRTAVAAPAMPPHDAIFEAIDKMTVAQLREFTRALLRRFVK